MIKTIFRYLLGLALSTGIAYIGILSVEKQIELEFQGISWSWFFSFIGMYFIIIQPVARYWSNIVCDLLDIKKPE